jgi:tetratricopeptide (TPR) repeat protein
VTRAAALDALFQALREAADADQARAAEHGIWQRWMESGDPRIDAWLLRGIQAMSARDRRAALSAFDAIVRAAPDFAEGWNKRATAHWLLGDHPASLRDIDRTLALEPRHFGALSGLALIHEANGRVFEALDALESVGRIHPRMPDLDKRIAALERKLAQGA